MNHWTSASYASPMVTIKKKNSDSLRLCINYTRLNRISVINPMPQQYIEDILAKLINSQLFPTFDACKCFCVIPMDDSFKDDTAFATGDNMYTFNVLPFVFVKSSKTYNKMTLKSLECGYLCKWNQWTPLVILINTWKRCVSTLHVQCKVMWKSDHLEAYAALKHVTLSTQEYIQQY